MVKEATMVALVLTIVVLSVLILVGYRLSMYLHAQGVVGVNTRAEQRVSSGQNTSSLVYDINERKRHYSPHYARTGILLTAGILAIVVLGLIVALSALLH